MYKFRKQIGSGGKYLIRAPKETISLIEESKHILNQYGAKGSHLNGSFDRVDIQKIIYTGTKRLDMLPSILKAGIKRGGA